MDADEYALHLAAGKHYGRKSACGSKEKHPHEEAATKVAASLNARPPSRKTHDVEPYPCYWCPSWHVGRVMTVEDRHEILSL